MKNYSKCFIFIFCILILLSACGNSPEIIITGSENSEIQTTEESKSNEDTTEAHQINWIEDERYQQQPEEYHISSQLKEFLTEYFQQQKYETVENHEMIDLIENVPYQDEEWTIIRLIYGADRHILSVRKTESGYNIEADVSYRNISKDDWETLVSIMIRAIQEHEKTHPVTPELVEKVGEKLKEKMFLPPIGGMEDLHEYLTEEEAEEIKNKMKVLFGVEENEKEAAEYILWSNGYNSIHDTMLAVTISCDKVEPIQKEGMNNPVTLPDIKFIVYATQEGEIQDIIINHEAMSSQEIEPKETITYQEALDRISGTKISWQTDDESYEKDIKNEYETFLDIIFSVKDQKAFDCAYDFIHPSIIQKWKNETSEKNEVNETSENSSSRYHVIYNGNTSVLIIASYGNRVHFLDIRKGTPWYLSEYYDKSIEPYEGFDSFDYKQIIQILTETVKENQKSFPSSPEMIETTGVQCKDDILHPPYCGLYPLEESLSEEEIEKLKDKMTILYDPEISEKVLSQYIYECIWSVKVDKYMEAVGVLCKDIGSIQTEKTEVVLPDLTFIVITDEKGSIITKEVCLNEWTRNLYFEQEDSESNTTDPIDTGEDQFYTGLRKVTLQDDMFSKGAALEDTYLYPCPTEKVYEIGEVYKGRTFDIIKKVESRDDQNEKEEWYLIQYNVEEESYLGYLKAEDVADANTVEAEPGEPYLMKKSDYYEDGSEEEYLGPLYLDGRDENTGKYKLISQDNGTAEVYYIEDLNILIPYSGLGPGRIGGM